MIKSLFESRTFWVACAQAVVALIAIFASTYPQAEWVGVALLVKSLVDMYLRANTSTPIGSVLPRA